MVKIIFSKTARNDPKEIIDYIKHDSVYYANLEKKRINYAIDKLIVQPQMGHVVPELGLGYLQIIFRNYRIIYQKIRNTSVYILAIHHHSRLLSNNPAFTSEC